MDFARKLSLRLWAALLAPTGVAEVVAFRLPDEGVGTRTASLAVLGIYLFDVALSWLVIAVFAGPIRRAQGGRAVPEPIRQRAAQTALRFPVVLMVSLFLGTTACSGALALADFHMGASPSDALLPVVIGAAVGIMAGMLAYALGVTAVVPIVARLGLREVKSTRTLRFKMASICLAVTVVTALLLALTGFSSIRVELRDQATSQTAAAQQRLGRWVQETPALVAEAIFLATDARTAILTGSGKVVAIAGGDVTRFLELGALQPGVERVSGGWHVVSGLDGGRWAVSFVQESVMDRYQRAWADPLLLLALLAAAVLMVWVTAWSLTIPIEYLEQAAERLASGDLRVDPPSVTGDEMGRLARDFRLMTRGLAALVADVRVASGGVHAGTREMREIGERVQEGARQEHERVGAVQAAVEAMQGSVAMVRRGVEALSDYAQSTAGAVGQMATALEEVRRQAAELELRMKSAQADIERLSEAGRQAQQQLASLETLVATAEGTANSVSATVTRLETSAVATQLASAQAAELSDAAGAVVREAVAGFDQLRAVVGDAKLRVAMLGRRSDDIDQVLDFIAEVAGRTNLLSLNASIIATQAGEHGKAFGVVADQIGELASQISSSTKSISKSIQAVRDDVAGTARYIDRGDELASVAVASARKTLDALHDLRAATVKGHEMSEAIRLSVQAHADSTHDVAELVKSVEAASQPANEAVQMVSKSVSTVQSLTRGVSMLADNVSRALEEQTGLGRRQMESLERIQAMLVDITRAVDTHDGATRRVRESLSFLARTAEHYEAVVVELTGVAERLGSRSRDLEEHIGKFKVN